MTVFTTSYDSPVGALQLARSARGLCGLYFETAAHAAPSGPWIAERSGFDPVMRQLDEYFAGRRRSFELALDLQGTPFQRRVWQALTELAYGSTCSYGALAASLGQPGAARAVGLANGRNPVAIIVPCHRVIGAQGALTGFGGGLARKRFLLDLERPHGSLFDAPAWSTERPRAAQP